MTTTLPRLCRMCVITLTLMALLALPLIDEEAQAWSYGQKTQQAALFSLGGWNQDYAERLEIALWLPSTKPEAYADFEGWPLLRLNSKPPVPTKKYPLLLISHDSVGNRFSLHDLAAELARSGFVVAAVTHPGDNLDDMSKSFSFEAFLGKPRQLVLTFDTLLKSPDFAPHIDFERVGVIGSGAGAAAALQLAGAMPSPDGWSTYCMQASDNDTYCRPATRQAVDQTAEELKNFLDSPRAFLLSPPLDSNAFSPLEIQHGPQLEPQLGPQLEAPPELPSEAKDKAIAQNTPEKENKSEKKKKNDATKGKATPPPVAVSTVNTTLPTVLAPPLTAHLDAQLAQSESEALTSPSKRVTSVLLLAPSYSFFFAPGSFSRDLPVALLCAADDEIYPFEKHALPLSGVLPGMPHQVIFHDVDHYSLLTPLPRKLTESLPELAGTATPDNRRKILEKRNKEAVIFFKATLGEPIELDKHPSNN